MSKNLYSEGTSAFFLEYQEDQVIRQDTIYQIITDCLSELF